MKKGHVFWLTGISGAGKTTLGKRLIEVLSENRFKTVFLDGDEVRDFFENDLGYSEKDRTFNVKRIAFAAKVAADVGAQVVVANIAPYKEVREFIRSKVPNYIEIYVKASLEEAKKRDVKGHYKKAQSGQLKNLIGVDDRYDVPNSPHVVVDTETESVNESLNKILSFVEAKGIFANE